MRSDEGSRSLVGKRVVVTRPAAQSGSLERALARAGAVAIRLPVIRVAPPRDPRALHRAAGCAAAYDWIAFTSANSVDAFMRARQELMDRRRRKEEIGRAHV